MNNLANCHALLLESVGYLPADRLAIPDQTRSVTHSKHAWRRRRHTQHS